MELRLSLTGMVLFLVLLSDTYAQKESFRRVIPTDSDVIYDLCFSPFGSRVAVADDREIKLFTTADLQLEGRFTGGHRDRILSIDLSQDSSLLVSGGKDSTIVLWDVARAIPVEILHHHQGMVTAVAISPDGRYVASGGTDHQVFLYSLKEKGEARVITGHFKDVTSVAFSPNGKWLASSGGDGTIIVYDLQNNTVLEALSGHQGWVREVQFTPDSHKLISCGDDSRLITWNMEDPSRIYKQFKVKVPSEWLLSLDIRDDNTTIACGGSEGKARIHTHLGIYSAKMGAPVTRIRFKPGEAVYLKMALATRGGGAFLMDGNGMKWSTR
jgi:WD40 repeat protein